MDVIWTTRTIGGTNRSRQLAGAAVLLLGAAACAVTTAAGWSLYHVLVVLGGAATIAWVVDGSSRRYMGPGLLALAAGGGISLYNALDTEVLKGEHGIVYPLIGIGLLVASLFNPLAVRGAGTFLLIVGAVALTSWPWNPGWTLAAILVLWSVANLARIRRTDFGAEGGLSPRTIEGGSARAPMATSRR